MATDEEIYKIILRAEGQEKLEALTARLRQAEGALADNIAAGGRYSAATRANAAAVKQLSDQVQATEKDLGRLGGSARGAGQLMIQAGYAVDDLQYGFKGIANNIQPILSSIPLLAAWAAPISIAAIAVYQLYEHWDQLAGLFGQGHVKTAAEEMEELRKKTSLTADEAERLARASNLEGKVKELRTAKTAAQKAEEDAATKAMVEAGSGNVARGLLKTAPDLVDSQGDAAVAKQELEKAKKYREMAKGSAGEDFGVNLRAAEAQVREAEEKLLKARKKTAEEIAASGALPAEWAGQRERIAELARKDPNAFGPRGNQLAKDLKEAGKTPDDVEEEKAQAHLEAREREFQGHLAHFQAGAQDAIDAAGERQNQLLDEHESEKQRRAGAYAQAAASAFGLRGPGRKLSDDEVRRHMEGSGYSRDEAAELAPRAAGLIREHQRDEIRQRAAKDGTSTSTAWKAMRREQLDASRSKLVEGANRNQDARDTIAHSLAAALGAGGNLGDAQRQIAEGLKGKYGAAGAAAMVRGSTGAVLREHAEDLQGRRKNSQVIDTAGLADSIQAAVGGGQDYQKQAVEQLKQANENLNKLANRSDNAAPILRK